MPATALRASAKGIRKLTESLNHMLHQADNLEPFMEEAAKYMVRSTKYRIKDGKRSPTGVRWPALSSVTAELKGHDLILFDSGELYRSIKTSRITANGFEIKSDAPHASFMQKGVRRTGGMIPGKRIPKRPFMGFSSANIGRLSKMLAAHLNRQGLTAGEDE